MMTKNWTWLHWIAAIMLFLLIVIPSVLAGYWLLWILYLLVIQALWPDGPYAVTHPGFWIFAGAFFLLKCLFRGVFGNSSRTGRR